MSYTAINTRANMREFCRRLNVFVIAIVHFMVNDKIIFQVSKRIGCNVRKKCFKISHINISRINLFVVNGHKSLVVNFFMPIIFD